MRAERERNLGQQMNQIQAQGSQAAYDQAANQFRQGITQDVAINQLQNQYGGQQQQLAQQGLSTNYQDFLNQQNYPYKQIGFMSDLVRGLPLGQQSTAQMYQAPPSTLQTVGALGMGAYGINQLSKGYAGGGKINAMNDQNQMADAVDKLTDEQLQQIIQNPSSAAELEAAKMELATLASERSGLAGAYNMAQGGVVAFAHGGIPRYGIGGGTGEDTEGEGADRGYLAKNPNLDGVEYGRADSSAQDRVLARLFAKLDAADNAAGLTLDSDEDLDKAATARAERLDQSLGGGKMYDDIRGDISKMRGENEGALGEGKGLAALQAAGAMLQGNDPIRGIGAAGSAFASAYAPALAAKRKADQAFTEMNINLSKARRAEKMGLIKDATTHEQNAQVNKINAFKANKQAKQLGIDALARTATAVRPAAGVKESDAVQAQKAFAAERANPDDPQIKLAAAAWRESLGLTRPSPISAGISAAAMGERTDAQIAAEAAKQAAETEEKREAARLQLEKDVAAEYTLSKLGMEQEYQEALTNAAKKVPGAKTPDQVRREIIAREVARRAGAGGTSKQKVIKLD